MKAETCAYCGSSVGPIYCFGDGEPICDACHRVLPNTIAACRHQIVVLQRALRHAEMEARRPEIPEGWRVVPEILTPGMRLSINVARSRQANADEIWDAGLIAAPELEAQNDRD